METNETLVYKAVVPLDLEMAKYWAAQFLSAVTAESCSTVLGLAQKTTVSSLKEFM